MSTPCIISAAEIMALAAVAAERGVTIKITANGAVTITASASSPMSPAERMRAMRLRKSVTPAVTPEAPETAADVTASVTPEPESVTNVTSVTHVTHVTNSDAEPSPSLPPPLPPAPPLSPAHTPPPVRSSRAHTCEAKRFQSPTLADWHAYAAALSPPYERPDAAAAWNFYESNGWKVGKNPMRNWQAACRTCHQRWLARQQRPNSKPSASDTPIFDRWNHPARNTP